MNLRLEAGVLLSTIDQGSRQLVDGVHNGLWLCHPLADSHSPTVCLASASLSGRVPPLHCRFGRHGSLEEMYTIAQRLQLQHGKQQMQETQSLLEDGEHNAPEQI